MLKILTKIHELTLTLYEWYYERSRDSRLGELAFIAAINASIILQNALDYAEDHEVRQYQEGKLRRIIGLARRTPAYRDLWHNIEPPKESEDIFAYLSRLPIVEKAHLRSYWPNGVLTPQTRLWRLFETTTSGSTGSPFKFFQDKKFGPCLTASYFRAFLSMGWGVTQPKIHIQAPWSQPRPWGDPSRVKRFDFTKLYDVEKIKDVVGFFLQTKTVLLEGFPSHLAQLARILMKEQIFINKCKGIMCYGEQMLPQEKELIEQALGPTISSYYGMNEVGYLAHLCMVRGGFHVNRANILLEIVGDDNQPLPPGKQGKILVTAFVNEVMPFVKYNTGDVGSFIEEKCPCGRTSPRISLVGRRDDMLELPNGKKIHSSQFHPIFYEFANSVLKYQIAFSRHQPPTVLVVPSAAWDQKTRSRLSQKLSSLLGPNFTIETVGDIPPLPSGKFQTVRRLS